jgi:hypothetical protein
MTQGRGTPRCASSNSLSGAARLVAAVRARGSDTKDARDAAHEASHALDVGAKRWDRESIHRALMKRRRGEQFASEVTARAVEQIVCAKLGVDCGTVEKWASVSYMEALKHRLPFSSYEDFLSAVRAAIDSREADRGAKRILALI